MRENETCVIGGNPSEDEAFIPISGKKALVCRGQGKGAGRADLRARISFCPGSEFNAHSCFAFLQLTHVDFSTYDIVDLHHRLEPKPG
ncbi:hypothetical protein Celaphus_00002225 [Cervus elaphus hippelaphus]|uniref:Uncharacterized protein n=1 Tax=Cervus elaphus hippelaphus TaxID=46360 RepID=A0A212CHY8_CEREH|nr:hypothetical protein Celaphus_00002225 [Cervus elaphus hippelaphus]